MAHRKTRIAFHFQRHCLATILIGISGFAYPYESSPLQLLHQQQPTLHALYVAYKDYAPSLYRYANQQGFTHPVENLATVIHEMVHVASAAHQGYYIGGVYYEPYVASVSWPKLTNQDVMPYMLAGEKGIMYSVYMASTPGNRLGNVLDELNAYNHVAPFVCRNESTSAQKQLTNLVGLLHVVEAYLRVARTMAPADYASLISNRASSGAVVTIIQNARSALGYCGAPPAAIPRKETDLFISHLKP